MFSYIDTVKSVTEREVFARGVRYYLEGRILQQDDLTLDNWREYLVQGHDEYYVKIPLLHLALSSEKFVHAGNALLEVASCNCPYFLDQNGICKHIVAVCASLEQEINPETNQRIITRQTKPLAEDVLENIFAAEVDRKIRKVKSNLEEYLQTSGYYRLDWFEQFVSASSHEPALYSSFLEQIKPVIERALRDYEQEKRVVNLINASLPIGNKIWWDFWKPFFDQISARRKIEVWSELWKLKILKLSSGYESELKAILIALPKQEKHQVMEIIQTKFPSQADIWLEFVFFAQYYEILEENMDKLDPTALIRLAVEMPEKRENIEIKLQNQICIWSDFLPKGDYDNLINILRMWKTELSMSEYLQNTVRYIQESHPKKHKLMSEMTKILEG